MSIFKKDEQLGIASCKKISISDIKILGSGCKKCNELEENTAQALKELGIDIQIDHVSDFSQIAAYGVMTTPALIVNGKVMCSGRVLKTNEIIKLLNK
ncbi:MAG: thioredoxin family protein [Oscillospiraceae bacterium]